MKKNKFLLLLVVCMFFYHTTNTRVMGAVDATNQVALFEYDKHCGFENDNGYLIYFMVLEGDDAKIQYNCSKCPYSVSITSVFH